jgi:hypothetical protein
MPPLFAVSISRLTVVCLYGHYNRSQDLPADTVLVRTMDKHFKKSLVCVYEEVKEEYGTCAKTGKESARTPFLHRRQTKTRLQFPTFSSRRLHFAIVIGRLRKSRTYKIRFGSGAREREGTTRIEGKAFSEPAKTRATNAMQPGD